jgi:translation elongation factor EF-1beta
MNNLGADEDSSPMLGFVNKAGFSPYSKSLNQNTPSSPNVVNPEDNSRLSHSSPPRKKDLSSSPLCRLKKCQIESQ